MVVERASVFVVEIDGPEVDEVKAALDCSLLQGLKLFRGNLGTRRNEAYKQATQLGGHVRKGEKGCPIIFWKEWETKDKHAGEDVKLPVLCYFTGFNVSQCDLSEGTVPTLDEAANDFTPIERCQHVVTR